MYRGKQTFERTSDGDSMFRTGATRIRSYLHTDRFASPRVNEKDEDHVVKIQSPVDPDDCGLARGTWGARFKAEPHTAGMQRGVDRPPRHRL